MDPDDLRLAYLAGDVGALVWEIDGDRLVVDELGERLFGLRRSTPGLGGTFADLLARVREDSRDALAAAVERALVAAALDVEVAIDLPDGSARSLQLRGTVLHDGDGGHPLRLVAAIRDVSALVAARRELAAARLELSVQGEELRRATAALDDSTSESARLLAHTSHEIRTRLQAILGMTRLLGDGALTPEQRAQVAMIEVSGQGLLGNITDLVDLTNLEAGVDAQPVELAALLADVTAAFVADGVRLFINAGHAPALRIDVARVGRVLHHVIGAVADHATPVTVTANATSLGGSLHELVLEVHGGRRDELGITIAERLVDLMGGTLGDDGAGIRVALPVDEAIAEPEPLSADNTLGARHPLRVLVAEDNAFSRKVAEAFLAKLGYTAKLVGNGREALDAIAAEPFDVVFMDMHMPVLDGFAAVRELRKDADPPRIIALTANAMPRDRAACLAAGCDEYLTKPVSIEKLARALRGCSRTPDVAIDPGALDGRVLGDLEATLGSAVVGELIATYDADARELLAGLRSAAARGDVPGLLRAAHNLKSTSNALGARALGATCLALETSGRSGELAGIAELVARAATELAHVRAALRQRVQR